MSFKLSNKKGYSSKEQKLFAQLGKKAISSTELLLGFYGGPKKVPTNGRVRMMNVMRSLQRKLIDNEEKFIVVHSPRAGPNPVEFRVTARTTNGK